jgi:integrase
MSSNVRTDGEVIPYYGKRGTTYRIRYMDGSGKRIKETLGHERDGWDQKRAEHELQDRLSDVRRDGYRAPDAKAKFEPFAREWLASYPVTKGLKYSTVEGYKHIVNDVLVPSYGKLPVHEVTTERIEREVARMTKDGLSASTINNTLNVLSKILKRARKRKLISGNPLEDVDRPRARARERRVLTPPEVSRVAAAFARLVERATGDALQDLRVARIAFLILVDTAVRRGELLGLKWDCVALADPAGPRIRIARAFTRNRWTEPKSDAGRRTISLSQPIAAALFEYRSESPYKAETYPVFCNWRSGAPIEPHKLGALYRDALVEAEIEDPENLDLFHNLRHSSLTNGAAAGMSPVALQARAGHASYATTRGYLTLAGVEFEEENAKHSERLWGTA